MKKRKNIKIIFNVFLSFVLILLFFCVDLQVFADDLTWSITFTCNSYSNGSTYFDLAVLTPGTSDFVTLYNSTRHGGIGTVSISFNYIPGSVFRVSTRNSRRTGTGIPYTYYYTKVTKLSLNNSSIVNLSDNQFSPTRFTYPGTFSLSFINSGGEVTNSTNFYYYFSFTDPATPTPEPTPTPTPAPTPTPLPVDYDDTQFWGRINDMAEGGWSAITATFNGIFNNTVFRNLVVYVPLFGAIIYLFVYLLFMGSD